MLTKGKVKWFNDVKGFGFVCPNDEVPEKDYFVHYSVINVEGYRSLAEGQEVTFEKMDGGKGPYASNVTPVGEILKRKSKKKNKEEAEKQ